MPRGDKRKYTDKQKRQAEHIEEGYKKRGMSSKQAAARAWATVNAVHGGGEKPGGGGYGKPENHEPMRKGGRKGGKAKAKTGARKRTATTKRTARKSTRKT
jgi:plasmid stabilization system protein ParE